MYTDKQLTYKQAVFLLQIMGHTAFVRTLRQELRDTLRTFEEWCVRAIDENDYIVYDGFTEELNEIRDKWIEYNKK